ncbi:MAG: hemolysin-III channel [Lasallia pustulata]|uniref:Hemolysin-III channel n=1 Tax=Lasallia pustulata TaxID=136370 RepID=A0A5M8Q5I6_9LECA|nr:MAG: hemolysin-III channel [Lasallia pustulata]
MVTRRRPRSPERVTPGTAAVALNRGSSNSAKAKARLLHWDELQPWQQDNHYIHSHYRPASNSLLTSLHSLTYLHTESVNVYTHLLGAICFLSLCIPFYQALKPRYASASTADVVAFGCFILGAVLCLGISAAYHLISNHSPAVNRLGNQLDYVGIVALITGSFVPSVYYGFYCNVRLQLLYWTMISTIGVGCTIVSVTPKFRTPIWRPFRAGMFVAMGLSAVFPVFHGLSVFGLQQMNSQIGLPWVVLQGLLYILGAGIYATRMPERLKPGSFDIWGSSHQIFHVLILLAAAAHLVGLLEAFDYAHTAANC